MTIAEAENGKLKEQVESQLAIIKQILAAAVTFEDD